MISPETLAVALRVTENGARRAMLAVRAGNAAGVELPRSGSDDKHPMPSPLNGEQDALADPARQADHT